MYPLSTFATLYNKDYAVFTNTFTEGVDFFLSGKSAYIALSSRKWDEVVRIDTSPVSALDYINADGKILSSLNFFNFTANQPFLTAGGQDYFYYLNSGLISAVGYKGDALVLFPGTIDAAFRDSFFDGSGNVTFLGNDIQNLILYNCAISGLIITEGVRLTAFNSLQNNKTYMDPVSLSNFIVHLCSYGKDYGNFIQNQDKGYNNNPSSGFNPFNNLTPNGITAMDYLTSVKNWTYYYYP